MDWFLSVVKCFVCVVHLKSEGNCVVLTLLPLECLTFMDHYRICSFLSASASNLGNILPGVSMRYDRVSARAGVSIYILLGGPSAPQS